MNRAKPIRAQCSRYAVRVLLAGALVPAPATAALAGEPPSAHRRAEIVNMVRQDCGSCHGLTLRGGLGPSLEARSLAGKDAGQLQYVIRNGRPGTPMPPWRDFLTESEAAWVVDQLMRGRLEGVQNGR